MNSHGSLLLVNLVTATRGNVTSVIRPHESDFGLAVRLSLDGFDKIRFEDHMPSTGEPLAHSQLGAGPSFHHPRRNLAPTHNGGGDSEVLPSLDKPSEEALVGDSEHKF